MPIPRFSAFVSALLYSSFAFTQPAAPTRGPAPAPVDQNNIPPPFTSSAEVYSGISGAGRPVVGDGSGGWRSGYEGVFYDGPAAKPGWKSLGVHAATGSAVKAGLLPPLKPIWDLHLRDTVINLGGDGLYYMTGSSGDNIWDRNDGIELWRSRDLKNWDYVGLVWRFEKDGTWQREWKRMHENVARNVWAPEIHYLKGKKNYFLTYSLSTGGTGILASTTGKPEGPYTSPLKPDARLTGGIDATLFEDDDGKIYMTWGRGGLIALMKDDLSGFADAPRTVVVDKTGGTAGDGSANIPDAQRHWKEIAQEGASLFKRAGKYYLGGATFWGGRGGRYSSVVAIADNIWGPYRQYHEAVPCGGGTNYFQDKQGNWWCAYFGNDTESPFREKPGLVRIDFAADGKIKIADEQPAFVLSAGAPSRWRPAPSPNLLAAGGNSDGYDMAPETRLEVVEAAVAKIATPFPPGPFAPTWESLKKNYRVPAWFYEAKFGLFMHWGVYSVPAHHNEWYEKHMYGADRAWHAEHFGPPDQFGYKDFIPRFTQENFDPDAWAELFKKSGARFVVPTAQHHDNFALWDSAVTPFNAKAMGPHRDLIGDLAKAVRARGLKFGVSNHGIENFQFINPSKDLADDLRAKSADLFDPKWTDFYHVADRSDAACEKFLLDWWARNVELIEKYQPDMLWFDNGVDQRYLDPLKLRVAAYYYNRATSWGKEVSISTKKAAYAPGGNNLQTIGSIIDFEKIGAHSPAGIRTGAWQVDHPIGSTWGYTSDMKVSGPASIIAALADTVAKNGTFLLNLSPRADGTFPPEQQDTLFEVGRWLEINGEAIYGTHNWTIYGVGGDRGDHGPHVRFTVKGDNLYAIMIGGWPESHEVTLTSLANVEPRSGKFAHVSLLGATVDAPLEIAQESAGLTVKLPAAAPCHHAYVLKITGLKMNPSTATRDGNPL